MVLSQFTSPSMEAAGGPDWAQLYQEKELQYEHLQEQMEQLRVTSGQLKTPIAAGFHPEVHYAPALPVRHHPPMPTPERYASEPESCKGFILQCSLYFENHPEMPEERRLAHFIELLSGCVLEWATTRMDLSRWGTASTASLCSWVKHGSMMRRERRNGVGRNSASIAGRKPTSFVSAPSGGCHQGRRVPPTNLVTPG
ncbi:hypothetical protein AMELA_G00269740 [Ameiurus melas]|uniref:DUF4939 domain-containing protein n=1 Tax=Ameiurus melas TaxID=219545 RepID=A0A7J5ZQX1_AMEME|nr:hypothetical protein AMELA_G00269740 [Ameiurus melas]